jgi:hypothetical protein
MPDVATVALAFACAYLAFAQLALCQAQHLKAAAANSRHAPGSGSGRKLLAALLLLGSLALLLGTQGAGFGTLLWALLASAAGFSVAQTLSWKAAWLRWMC